MSAIATVKKPGVNELMKRCEDKTLSFASRITSVGDVMKAMSPQLSAALPRHISVDRMTRVVLNAIRKNPGLLKCTAPSLFGAIIDAATYGWEIGGPVAEAHLVPYGDECVLVPGYRGYLSLARRSGEVTGDITHEVVHEGDHFTYSLGDTPHITHQPNDADPERHKKPITHVYLSVPLRSGGRQRTVWTASQIDAHKERYSQAWQRAEKNGKKDSPWHTSWVAMAKKTLILDMAKRGMLPLSPEDRTRVERFTASEERLDVGGCDIVPDSPLAIEETHERPQTSDEPNPTLLESVAIELDEAGSKSNCEAIKAAWLPQCQTEADRTAVAGLCDAKAVEIHGSRGERSNK